MLDVLSDVWDAIRSVPYLLADFLVAAFNAIIVAFGGLMQVGIAILPGFPDAPANPPGGVLGLIAWVAPLGALVSGFALMVTCWIAFLGVKIALRWVKAL